MAAAAHSESAIRRAKRGSVSLKSVPELSGREPPKTPHSSQVSPLPDDEQWCWIKHATEGYVLARMVADNPDGSATVQTNGSTHVAAPAQRGPLVAEPATLSEGYSDMVKMVQVDEASILHNLKLRFEADKIYTNIGTILVSINPFTFIEGLYSAEQVDAYRYAQEELSPHVFGIAAAAYKGLVEDANSQAIIISGESGAGKTEATKKCLQFFAQVAAGGQAGMDQKLLAANPILEAFGNAKTVRNNNSSRFGKWMEVQFSSSGGIIGCRIVNYLLEKSRIVHPAGDERSYHIFYNLFVGLDSAEKAALHLTKPEDFEYLRHASTTISGSSKRDVEDFSDVVDAFKEVGMAQGEQDTLFRLSAAVLHLGSIEFEVHDTPQGAEGSAMVPSRHVDAAAELLGVSTDDLSTELTSRVRVAGGDTMRSPLVPAKAADARDALAKAIYGRMFDWLVLRVNQAMHTTEAVGGIIGVLDIFGFEIFETNVFEQLCINFCNEMLQQHFNTHVFKVEEQLYIDEGIDYSNVEFIDNQDVLDLIQKRPAGILPMLDDEVKLPRGSDSNFLARINKAHAGHSRFLALKAGASGNKVVDNELGQDAGRCGNLPFAVKHYAGGVVYECSGWLNKNKDEIMPNHAQLMVSSSDSFLSEVLFGGQEGMPAFENSPGTPNAGAASAAGAGKGKSKTQAGKFRAQLSALRETLNANKPHYIRCIKPNSVKKPSIWHGQLCLQQLRYSGIFEAVRIRQQGFPFRYTFRDFYGKYASVVDISAEELTALGPAATPVAGGPFPSTAGNNRRKYRPVPQERHRSSPWHSKAVTKAPHSDAFYRSMCQAIMRKMAGVPDAAVAAAFQGLAVQTGHTMQFYQAAAHHQLTKRRTTVRRSAAVDLQTAFRRWSARLRVQRGLAALAKVRQVRSIRTLAALDEAVSAWDATRAACRLPDLAEVAEVRKLRDRLQAEADCRAECEALLQLDPTQEYQRFLRVVKQAEEFELAGGAVDAAKAKFQSVRAYYQAKEDLEQGCAQHDKARIHAAQAAAASLRAMWGDVFDAAELQAAEAALAAIRAEEERLQPLVAAMATGSITQQAAAAFSSCAVGPSLGGVEWGAVATAARSLLDVSGSHVQDHLSVLGAGKGLLTPTGRALARAAGSVVAARSAIQEAVRSQGAGGSVDAALSALTALQEAIPPSELEDMPDELKREVQAAHATHLNLKHCRALAAAVARGAPSGECGELDMSGVDSKSMLQRSAEAHAAFDDAAKGSAQPPEMCSALKRLVKTAAALCPLRSAMAGGDWGTVRGLLATIDGIDATVPCAQVEVHVAFDEIDNLDLLAACAAAFAAPCVAGSPGAVDVGGAEDAVARADAALGSGTAPKSRAAKAHLAFIAGVLRPLRRAAGERDWDEVKRLLRPLADSATRSAGSGGGGSPMHAGQLDSTLRAAMQAPLALGEGGAPPAAVPAECHPELALACAQALHSAAVAALAHGVTQGRLVGLPGSIAVEGGSAAAMHGPSQEAALHQWAFRLQAAQQLQGTVASRNGKRQSVSLGATPWGSAFTLFPPVLVSSAAAQSAVAAAREHGTLSACSESTYELVEGLTHVRKQAHAGDWAQCARTAKDLLQRSTQLRDIPELARRRYEELPEAEDASAEAFEASAPEGVDELVLAAQAGTHGAEAELLTKLCACVAVELQTVVDHAALQAATAALAAAMKRGGLANSAPGALRASEISSAELQAALSSLVACPGVLRGSALALHGVGSLQVAVRRALSSSDWAETQRLLEGAGLYDADVGAVQGSGGEVGDEATGLAAVALALPEAGAEMAAAIAHLDNWRVCSALSRALTTRRIAGQPGAVDVSQCGGAEIESALALAGALGAQSARARRLQAAAAALLELRNALLAALEAAPGCGSALHEGAAAGACALPGSWAAVQAAVRTCQRCAKQDGTLDTAGDETAAAPLEQPLQSLMAQEVLLVARDVGDRASAMALWAALASPGPTGAIGAIVPTSVHTSRLTSALAAVSEHGVFSKPTEALAGAVQCLLGLRSAARAQDVAELRAALERLRSASQGSSVAGGGAALTQLPAVAGLVADELQKYRDECDHARIVQLLQDSIEAGAARGSPAAAQLQGLRQGVSQLTTAVHEVKDIGAKAPAAVALLAAAEHLLAVRQAAVDSDWAGVLDAVSNTEDASAGQGAAASAPPSMAREIALLRGEARYQQLCTAVHSAVASQPVTGTAEEIDVSGAGTAALDEASALADSWGVASRGLRQALDASAALRRARSALLQGDLAAARDAVAAASSGAPAATSAPASPASGATSPSRLAAGAHDESAAKLAAAVTTATAEMALIRTYVAHTMALAAVAAALSSGAGTWRHATGDVDPASVRADSLRRAVAAATGSDTAAVVFAASLAKALLRVRRGQADRELGEVEAGLQDASAVPGVSAGLSQGAGATSSGSAGVSRTRVGAESAVRASIAGMFGRSDQLAPGMPDTLSVMDSLASRQVPACTVQELSRARAQVVNSSVLATVKRAVESGQATGRLGNLNLESLDSQVLQAAEDKAVAELGMHGPSAAVDEALLTLRQLKAVREAVLGGSWGEVGQLVGDALAATGTPLLAGAVAEVRLLHCEARLRQAVAALGAALVADGLQGCVSEVSSGNASAQHLEAAMTAAERVPGQLSELSQLVAAARYMRRLRTALNSQDWSAAAAVAADVAAAAAPALAGDSVPQASQSVYSSAVAAAGVAMDAAQPLGADCPVAQAWEQHPLVRSGAVPLAGCAHLKAALFAAPEVWLARAEALWQSSSSALRRAARSGAVTGMAGAVELSSVSTGQLRTTMQGLADQWGRLLSACGVRGVQLWRAAGLPVPSHAEEGDAATAATARNLPPRELLSMLESARYLASLRQAVEEGRWSDIHAAAAGREVDGVPAAPTALHGIAAAEVELICTEASVRATAAQLTDALRSGCVRAWAHGAGGGDAQPVTEAVLANWDSDRGVDTTHMTTEQLEDAVSAAEAVGLSTSASARLLATAHAMLAVRRAAASGDWQGVLSSVTTGADSALGTSAVPVTSLHVFVQAEARLLLSHAANQAAASALLPHFTAGAAQGSTGHLELAAVDAASLRTAVQKLAGVPLTASRPRLLMASAHHVAKVRVALGGEGGVDWHTLGSVLQDVARKDVAEEALPELQLVADSHRAHTLEATLRAACARGSGGAAGADGTNGSPTRSTVLVHSSDLARAVKLVKDATAGSAEGQAAPATADGAGRVSLTRPLSLPPALSRLLRFADALAGARQAAAAEDWQGVAGHLDSMQEQGLDAEAQVAAVEIRGLRRTVADQACQRQLLAALQDGAICGALGDLDVTPVSGAPLQGAIAAAEQLAGASPRTASLLATARAALAVRSAVVDEDWDAVSASLPAVPASPSGSLLADECQLLRRELDNRRAVAALEHALDTGGVEGDIGALKLDKVQLAPLATAVADASDLQQQAPRTQGTLRVARLVLGVRRSLLANDWPRVRAALAPFRAALVAAGSAPSSAEASDAEDAPTASQSAGGLQGGSTQGALSELKAVAPDMVQRLQDTLPPNDLAALALAPELVLVLRQIQDSAVAAQLSQALLSGAARGSPADLDLSSCDSGKLHAAVQLADTVGAKSEGTLTLNALAVHVASVRDALLCGEYGRVPQLVSAAVSCAGRHSGIPHTGATPEASSPGGGASDPFAPLEAWVSNPMRQGAEQFQLAHTPDGSLARSAEDGLVYTPVILTQSRLPDDVAPVVQRELRLAQAVAALSAVQSVAQSCFDKGRPEGEPGGLQLQRVSLDSLDRTQELISALPPEHTPAHLSVTLAAVKAVRSIRRGLLTDDWVAVEAGVEQAGEMGGDLPAAAAHDVELAVAALHHRAVVHTGPLPAAIRSGGPPKDSSTVGAMDSWTEELQLNALDTGLAHAAAIGSATPAAQGLVRSAAFLRRVRAAAKAHEWELVESLLSTADDAGLLQEVLPELDRYRLELAHSRAVAALVSGIQSGHGMITVPSQWRQRSRSEIALLKATANVAPARDASPPHKSGSPATELVPRVQEQVEVEGGQRIDSGQVPHVQEQVEVEGGQRIDSGQVHLASLDAAIELADDVGMHSDSGAVLLRTAKVLRKLRSCVVHDDLAGLVAALEEARAGPLHSMAHEQLKAMLVEFDDRAVCAELVQALEQGRPTGSGGGAMSLAGVSVEPLDKAIAYAAAVGTRSHRAETLLLSARVIRTLRWELLHPGSDQHTLSAALAVAEAQALAPEASTELHTVRNDILASMACMQLREALSFGSGVVTLRKALPRSPMPQSGAGDSDLTSPLSTQESSVDVAEVRIDVSNVQLAALDDAIERGCAVGRHPPALTVLLSSAQAVRDVRAALLGGDWEEAAELARQYMDMPNDAVSGASMTSTGDWLSAAAGHPLHTGETAGLAHNAREELMGVQRALGLVHARGDAVHGLLSATSSADDGQLKAALRRAREVGLEGSDDPTARGAMVSARDKLITVGRVKAQLSAAIASSHLPTLRAAVQSADEVGYTGQEAQVAQETADAIQTLLQDSRAAMDNLDDTRMMDVLRRADSLGISLPEAARMRQLLAMPAKDRLHLQLQAALKSGDVHRIAHTTMGIKRVFFAETSRSFSLSAYPGLRAFHEMADAAGLSSRDHSAHIDAASHLSRVLMHSTVVLKGSLSQLPANLQTGAVALSTYILQYCGDQPREFAYPDTIAQELLQLALATPLLRDEVFIQLIRSMTGNHDVDSLQSARQLMFLCCSCFPPSEALENYLEAFLRRAREDACVYAVHKTAYSGAVPATPTIVEIREMLLSLHGVQQQELENATRGKQSIASSLSLASKRSVASPPAVQQPSGNGTYGSVQAVAPPTAGSVSRSLRFNDSFQGQTLGERK